jgi:hypothetical protein
MGDIQILIIFATFLFAASLFYSAKKKSESLFSFMLNLEFEYIIVGAMLYLLTDAMPLPVSTLNGALHLLLAFMGLALGSHFSFKLLKEVPSGFYIVSVAVYVLILPLFYFIMKSFGSREPMMMAIALNTLMPYSLNLSMKLFRIPKDKVFVSNLISSLFPLLTLTAYTAAAGITDFRPADFVKSAVIALILVTVFVYYGRIKSKKSVHSLTILFVVLISGVAMYYSVSPLVLGFLAGLSKSDSRYGNIFQGISISFERILYIFFYLALGVMLAYGFRIDIKGLVTAAGLYASLYAVRYLAARVLIVRLLPNKGDMVCLMSTGILPAVILLDHGIRHGFIEISELFVPFFLVHAAAEITTYFMMRNERKIY